MSAEKKTQPEKKNTADQQKEWVSGSSIFSREKIKYETFDGSDTYGALRLLPSRLPKHEAWAQNVQD